MEPVMRDSWTMVSDHDIVLPMDEIQISKFKATCLSVLERVGRTGQPVLVTRFGKPVAEVVPPPKPPAAEWLGAMRNQGAILGDLIEPVAAPDEWEAVSDALEPPDR